MGSKADRRSARHLLGEPAEVHLGSTTHTAIVRDVSAHGLGIELDPGTAVEKGELAWILCGRLATFAITGTVVRVDVDSGQVGIQFLEILEGSALETIASLPLSEA
ncbi:MAG: PilZ domain-containing protein [Deltaproteobacteria bacterium]|nr:PilZ domain-containing protein [Deltaproteobacteria bacterium]